MKNQLSQVTVTQTLSVILFSEQKLTHFTSISCEIQWNVIELIKHLSKHLSLRFNLATNEISLTKSPTNPAQCYTERFHQTEPFGSLILSTLTNGRQASAVVLINDEVMLTDLTSGCVFECFGKGGVTVQRFENFPHYGSRVGFVMSLSAAIKVASKRSK